MLLFLYYYLIGTYNNLTSRGESTSCLVCGNDRTTLNTGSSQLTDCICNKGFFEDNGTCVSCAENFICDRLGMKAVEARVQDGFFALVTVR